MTDRPFIRLNRSGGRGIVLIPHEAVIQCITEAESAAGEDEPSFWVEFHADGVQKSIQLAGPITDILDAIGGAVPNTGALGSGAEKMGKALDELQVKYDKLLADYQELKSEYIAAKSPPEFPEDIHPRQIERLRR